MEHFHPYKTPEGLYSVTLYRSETRYRLGGLALSQTTSGASPNHVYLSFFYFVFSVEICYLFFLIPLLSLIRFTVYTASLSRKGKTSPYGPLRYRSFAVFPTVRKKSQQKCWTGGIPQSKNLHSHRNRQTYYRANKE